MAQRSRNKLMGAAKKPVPVKIVSDTVGTLQPTTKYDDWQVKDALRTLTEAEKIRSDRKLMSHVRRAAKEQAKALHTVCGNKPSGR